MKSSVKRMKRTRKPLKLRRRRKKKVELRHKKTAKRAGVNQLLDAMHSNGYQAGFKDGEASGRSVDRNQAYNHGYDDGYKNGRYAGGDAHVDFVLPFDAILPEITIEQIVEAGIQGMAHLQYYLKNAEAVAEQIRRALEEKTPFSLVRLGDGELLAMAQESVMSIDEVRREGAFLKYAGVEVPDLSARDQLVASVKQATIVGIPKLRNHTYQPLAFRAFAAHGIDYRALSLTHSLINYYLYKEGRLEPLLQGRSVLLVGNKMPEVAPILERKGIHVTAVVAPVQGVKDVDRVLGEIGRHSFDIALVSSGISAVLIAQRIASNMGKVAIDFGHLADELVRT